MEDVSYFGIVFVILLNAYFIINEESINFANYLCLSIWHKLIYTK